MKTLFLALLFISSVASSSEGPVRVGNGTGESEYTLFVAHRSLTSVIQICRVQAVCEKLLEPSVQVVEAASRAQLKFAQKAVGETSTIHFDRTQLELVVSLADDIKSRGDAFRLILSAVIDQNSLLARELGSIANTLSEYFEVRASQSTVRITGLPNAEITIATYEESKIQKVITFNFGSKIPCEDFSQTQILNPSLSFETNDGINQTLHLRSTVYFNCGADEMIGTLVFSIEVPRRSKKSQANVPDDQIFVHSVRRK